MYAVQTPDGTVTSIRAEFVNVSSTMRTIAADSQQSLVLLQGSGRLMTIVSDFLEHFGVNNLPPVDTDINRIAPFELELFNLPGNTLVDLIVFADYLKIESLANQALKRVAVEVKGKSQGEILHKFSKISTEPLAIPSGWDTPTIVTPSLNDSVSQTAMNVPDDWSVARKEDLTTSSDWTVATKSTA